MAHLGSFGAAVRELDPTAARDTFDFFGQQFEVVGTIPPMLMLQLGAAASGKLADAEGMAAMWETFRCSLATPERDTPDGPVPSDEAQFNRFYRLAVDRACEVGALMDLAFALFEAQSGRPTEEPRGSSAGPSSTGRSSSTSSSTHPALAHLRPVSEVLQAP